MTTNETLTHKPQEITGEDGIARIFRRVESLTTMPDCFGFKGDEGTYQLGHKETYRSLIKQLREGYGLQGVNGITTDGKWYRYERD